MKKVTLKNSFHNTELTILSEEENAATAWQEIQMAAAVEDHYGPARRRLARIRNRLCGSTDCKCGVVRG